VGTDAGSEEVLRQAARVASTFGARLGVAHVLPPGFPEQAVSPHAAGAATDDIVDERRRRAHLRELVGASTGLASDAWDELVDRGDPAQVLIDRAKRYPADLVVVGTHDRRGVERLLLGSVAEKVVRGAPCPVLVIRAPLPIEDGEAHPKLLAACDLEATTQQVLSWSKAMSKRFAEPIVAAHAVRMTMSDVAMVATAMFSGAVPTQPDAATAQGIHEVATGALGAELTAAAVDAEVEVLDGPPAESIIARAKQIRAGLVVVGTHGKKGLTRLALGSVAEAVVKSAPCNVLVVR